MRVRGALGKTKIVTSRTKSETHFGIRFELLTACSLLLLALALTSCRDNALSASETQPPTSEPKTVSICEVLKVEAKQVERTVDGCPVIKPSIPADRGNLPAEQLDKIVERELEKRSNTAALVRAAERDGMFEEPEFAHALMTFVRERYLDKEGVNESISMDEARAYFDTNRDEFGLPEIRIGRILWVKPNSPEDSSSDRERVEAHANEIRASENPSRTFIGLVGSESDHPTKMTGGLMEPTARKGERRVVSEPVAEALFELEGEEELSKPFAVEGGWAVVSLVKTVPGREPQFERVNAMIKSKIRRKRVERFVEKLRDE